MRYSFQEIDGKDGDEPLYNSLEQLIRGMGMALIELSVFRPKAKKNPGKANNVSPSVSLRVVVYKDGAIGLDDCSKIHRGIIPRLELAFPGQEINLEVSSPGIDRIIKDGREFNHYIGRGVKCYCTDISDWTAGILLSVDHDKVVLRCEDGEKELGYEVIAKARLN